MGVKKSFQIGSLGRSVIKNLMSGIVAICQARREIMADAGSLSPHSSKASTTIIVEIRVILKGSTTSSVVWLSEDSFPISGRLRRVPTTRALEAGNRQVN